MGQKLIVALACCGLFAAACTTGPDVSRTSSAQRDSPESTTTVGPPGTNPVPPGDLPPLPSIEIGDPNVRTGVLANGLTYFVRSNDNPGGSAQLRLAIDAGSGREQADQSGVAHFLEHMLFNGTASFPKNELIDVLRNTGAQFGADVNAYTSYDETVYELNVPTNDGSSLETGLDVLAEWLSAATLDPDEVVNERGVVLDEWRTRQESSGGRIQQAFQQMFLGGSVYDGHSPIGTSESIEAMTPELLRRFYDDWYRPDNAAIVVIGAIDVDEVAAGIAARFDPAVSRGSNPPAEPLPITPSTSPLTGLVADPDVTRTAVELALPTVATAVGLEAVRQTTLDGLVFQMIANRLGDDATLGSAPFDDAYVDNDSFVRALDAPSIVVVAKSGEGLGATDALLDEFERVHRFGFDAGELQRVVGQFRSSVDSVFAGRDTRQDADYADTYVDSFLVGTPVLTEQAAFDLSTFILDSVTVEQVNARFEQRWSTSAPHVMAIGPESDVQSLPTVDGLAAAIASLPGRSINQRPATEPVTGPLVVPPSAITETATEVLPAYDGVFIDPVQLEFANGVTLILNPSPIVEGQLTLSAQSIGGLANVAADDVIDGRVAADVVTTGGLATFTQSQLNQLLAGSTAELYPSIGPSSDGLDGFAATDDIESLFQLIYLYMTNPRFDPVALENVLERTRSEANDPTADQTTAAYDALYRARYGDDPRFRYQLTTADAESVDLASVERVWRTAFGNATGWTFAIAGDFAIDDVTALARVYLGNLVATAREEPPLDIVPPPPPAIVTETINAGTGERGTLLRWYSAPVDPGVDTRVLADLATEVISSRILNRIREDLGDSYSPSASFDLIPSPVGAPSTLELSIDVTSAPDQVEPISAVVTEEIAEIVANGPTAEEFDAAVAIIQEQYLINNSELVGVLLGSHTGVGETAADYYDRYESLFNMTPSLLADFFAANVPVDQYIEVQAQPR